MPRKSYEQHLAEKAAMRRRGSVIESETDAESLFSNTTCQSQLSSSTSPYLSPHQHRYLPGPSKFARTLSSNSYSFSVSSPYPYRRERSNSPGTSTQYRNQENIQNVGFSSFPPPLSDNTNPSDTEPIPTHRRPSQSTATHLTVPQTDREIARKKRHEQRKLSKSTLLSSKYDSPIRRSIRYLTTVGLHQHTTFISLIFYVLIKLLVMRFIEGRELDWVKGREEVMWGAVIYEWVKREGEKGGRSLRSQVIALLTILLSPLSLFVDKKVVPMSMTIRPLTLLSSTEDYASVFYLFLSLTINQFHAIWAMTFGLYVIGRGIWIGGFEGSKYAFLSFIIGATALGSRYSICESNFFNYIYKQITFDHPAMKYSTRLPTIPLLASYTPTVQNQVNEYCKATVPSLTISSLVNQAITHKIQSTLTIFSIMPPITILLYSNISLRPGPSTRPSPTISFLPLLLFLISIPIYLFSNDPHDIILPLMPLTLMMSFRGSAARGSERSSASGGGEDEVWRTGVVLNALSIIDLIPYQASLTMSILSTGLTVLWITLIGASPLISIIVVLRQISIMIIPSNVLVQYINPLEQVVLKGAFAIGWFWGMKKLIENAWAIGGLSGRKKKSREKVR
ncbi:hypothetical protein L486_06932 [Kwoniella mangroviensis CBS 10435]|uniref:Uncharacterized protein n=1 Tax=Kwoniella mangroviensis CBS 10435 TaxID=1331196 RepID=A0A1B9IIE9_9TREE|nr:hypothetical protein L486_06932 [Kwoniella mangroviensis CBS 10435]